MAASVIFTQSLIAEVAQHAPSLSFEAVNAAGSSASGVRSLVPGGGPVLDGLLLAYSISVDRVFYLLAACSAVSFIASWWMGWTDTRKKNAPEKPGE